MAGWDDVHRIALELPESEAGTAFGHQAWRVRKKLFAWERPLRDADLEALGESAPEGPILGARVEDLVAKEALIADEPDLYFTTPHFDGHASVLVQLARIDEPDLRELLAEAWLARAPRRLASAFLEQLG